MPCKDCGGIYAISIVPYLRRSYLDNCELCLCGWETWEEWEYMQHTIKDKKALEERLKKYKRRGRKVNPKGSRGLK